MATELDLLDESAPVTNYDTNFGLTQDQLKGIGNATSAIESMNLLGSKVV